MKFVNKKDLDELIRLTHKYAKTGDVDILSKRREHAISMCHQVYGNNHAYNSFIELVGSLCGVWPLVPNCTNQKVYDVFKLIGIDILQEDSII